MSMKLEVVTPFDFRATADEPYIVREPKVILRVTVQNSDPLTRFEWVIGGKAEAGKLDAKSNTETRELTLTDGAPLAVEIRAQTANSRIGLRMTRG